jgi:hypothetical protein
MTVQRRIADIFTNLIDQLKQRVSEICVYSVTMDESTDLKDTAQLLIFIKALIKTLKLLKNLLACCPCQVAQPENIYLVK